MRSIRLIFSRLYSLLFPFRRLWASGLGMIVVCCISGVLLGQSTGFEVDEIGLEAGLASRHVNCFHQDKWGFLWVGSRAGIERYDGREWQLYNRFSSPALGGADVLCLAESEDGVLWIGTSDGLSRLNATRDTITHFESDATDPASLSDNRVRSLLVVSGDEVLVGTDNGTLELFRPGKGFELMDAGRNTLMENSYSKEYIYNPFFIRGEDRDRHVWVQDVDGLMREYARTPAGGYDLAQSYDLGLISVAVDDSGQVWGTTANELMQFDFSARTFRSVRSFPMDMHASFVCLNRDGLGQFWWITPDSILKWNPLVDHYATMMAGQLPAWKSVPIYSWFEDREGGIWLGHSEGIAHIQQVESPFHFWDPAQEMKGGEQKVGGLGGEGGQDVFADIGGGQLAKIEGKTGEVKPLGQIWSGFESVALEGNTLWIASGFGGLCEYNLKTGSSTFHFLSEVETAFHEVLVAPDGIWVGLGAGIARFDPATQQIERFESDPLLNVSRVRGLFLGNQNVIWAATGNGLFKIDPSRETSQFYNIKQGMSGLRTNYLLDVIETASGKIWCTSSQGGLIEFDPEREEYQHFTQRNGLCNNFVNSLVEWKGMIWMGTEFGLAAFDPETETFTNYFGPESNPFRQFLPSAALRTETELWFSMEKGFLHFAPDELTKSEPQSPADLEPQMLLSAFICTDQVTEETKELASSWIRGEVLELNPGDRDVEIRFALASYFWSGNHEFSYQLSNGTGEWIELGTTSVLRFKSLPAGTYDILIRGKVPGGEWTRSPLTIPIHKPDYFYNQPQTWIGAFLLLLGIVGALIYFRSRQVRRTREELEEKVALRTAEVEESKAEIERQHQQLQNLDELKTRFFANISHELRTPLTLLLGHIASSKEGRLGEIPPEVRAKLEISEKNGLQLLALTEEILDLSKLEAGQLKVIPKPIRLNSWLRTQMSMFKTAATDSGMSWEFETQLPDTLVVALDPEKFTKIVRNLLSNALKYTPQKGGSVRMFAEPAGTDSLLIRVKDTGRGIHPEDLPFVFDRFFQTNRTELPVEGGTGIGLALSSELAELVGGKLTVKSEWQKGSEFRFLFPFIKTEEEGLEVEPLLASSPGTVTKLPTSDSSFSEPASQSAHILVVEDHPEMRAYIQEMLIPNFDVTTATDGVQALEKLADHSFDLVVSDLMMPRMDGFQLLEKLKSTPAFQHLPTVLLTARAGMTDKLEAFRIGVDDYLIKPFHPPELIARIEALLRNKSDRAAFLAEDSQFAPEPQTKESAADVLLRKAQQIVSAELANANFSVADLAFALSLSERQVYREIKAVTGMTPLKFIRELRLQHARQLLENKTLRTASEVMHAVGFQRQDYFSRMYKERFGRLPVSYL